MTTIEINKIIVNKRKRTAKDIEQLAESFKSIGLMNPITVNKNYELIAGYHRLESCKKIGWKEIPVIVLDANELNAELAEIDENLIRTPLTALEEAEQMKRRKEIYEILHPESKPEEQRKKGLNMSNEKISLLKKQKTFTQDTAEKIKKSQRSIQQDIQIASNIPEEVKQEIKGSKIENKKSDLIELTKVKEPEKQKELVKKVKTGQAKNIKTALQEEQPLQETEEEIHISVELYENVKFALDEAEYELDLVKKETEQLKIHNQELKTENEELKKQLQQEKKEEVKNEVIENSEKIDYQNRKVFVDDKWLELPPTFDMTGKSYEQMYWVANNYNVNKQKRTAKTALNKNRNYILSPNFKKQSIEIQAGRERIKHVLKALANM